MAAAFRFQPHQCRKTSTSLPLSPPSTPPTHEDPEAPEGMGEETKKVPCTSSSAGFPAEVGPTERAEHCSLTESLEIGCLTRLEFLPKSDQRTFLNGESVNLRLGWSRSAQSFTQAVMPLAYSTLYFTPGIEKARNRFKGFVSVYTAS